MEAIRRATAVLGENPTLAETAAIGCAPGRSIRDRSIIIGDRPVIRSNTVIYDGVRIGDDLETGHNVVIREESRIGSNFSIWHNSVVDYGCRIGNNVKVHSNCYIAQHTVIEDGVFLAPGVTIANDIHPGCAYSRSCMRGPVIKRGAQVGVNATILPRVTIGEYALVGAGSVVTKDVPPRAVVSGNPARVMRTIDELTCKTGLTDRPYKKDTGGQG